MYLNGVLPDGPDAPLGSFTAQTGDFYMPDPSAAAIAAPDVNPTARAAWLATSLEQLAALNIPGKQQPIADIPNYSAVDRQLTATDGTPSVGGSRSCGGIQLSPQGMAGLAAIAADQSMLLWGAGALAAYLFWTRKGRA